MEKIKNITILFLGLIILVFFLRECNKTPNITETKIEEIHDTIYKRDTVISLKTVIKPKHDTIYKVEHITDSLLCNYIREYNDSLIDSNQVIFYSITTTGTLDSLILKYKLKVPVLIENTKIITTKKTIIKPYALSIYTGLEVGTASTLSFFASINNKNKNFHYKYNLTDKSHNVGIGFNIYNSKK